MFVIQVNHRRPNLIIVTDKYQNGINKSKYQCYLHFDLIIPISCEMSTFIWRKFWLSKGLFSSAVIIPRHYTDLHKKAKGKIEKFEGGNVVNNVYYSLESNKSWKANNVYYSLKLNKSWKANNVYYLPWNMLFSFGERRVNW